MSSNKFNIDIKYFNNDLKDDGGRIYPYLEYIDGKSDWIDLRASEDVDLKPYVLTYIKLGVAMKLPEGYEAIIAPRSSSYKNFHILQTNSIGVVDNSYCGDADEWMMPVISFGSHKIMAGDRVCQFRIIKNQPKIEFNIVDKLSDKDRGGFGSTGKS